MDQLDPSSITACVPPSINEFEGRRRLDWFFVNEPRIGLRPDGPLHQPTDRRLIEQGPIVHWRMETEKHSHT